MDLRITIALVVVVLFILTQLPTIGCILSHSPEGDLDTTTAETGDKIVGLVSCVPPTSKFGLALFLVGGLLGGLIEQGQSNRR